MKEKTIGGICVCGADQQGKSYVCERLHEELGFDIYHFSRPGEETDYRTEYVMPILKRSDSGNKVPFIFDRSYVSEIVYGTMFRGLTGITPEIKQFTETVLNFYGYVLVYLKRENYSWTDREEMYTKDDNVKVIERYDEIYPTLNLPRMQIDSFEHGSIDKIIAFYMHHNPGYGKAN